jgi:hypothetical protein
MASYVFIFDPNKHTLNGGCNGKSSKEMDGFSWIAMMWFETRG